jgi:hypothetical protein
MMFAQAGLTMPGSTMSMTDEDAEQADERDDRAIPEQPAPASAPRQRSAATAALIGGSAESMTLPTMTTSMRMTPCATRAGSIEAQEAHVRLDQLEDDDADDRPKTPPGRRPLTPPSTTAATLRSVRPGTGVPIPVLAVMRGLPAPRTGPVIA